MKKISFVMAVTLLTLLSCFVVNAATISGNVYGPSLELLKGTIVKVNSTPEQTIVARDGSYNFELPLGIYKIEAKYYSKEYNLYDEEAINLKQEGNYIIDLILLQPAEEDIFVNDSLLGDLSDMLPRERRLWLWWFLLIPVAVVIVIIFFIIKKRKKKPEPDEVKQRILEIIKREKRIKQKELRRKIGMSEAKISLVITELEAEGKVKKIKKGRGNIIIYQHG